VSPAPTLLMSLGTPEAYPGKLQTSLAERYTAQTIVVTNRGLAGEELDEGVERLPGVLDEDRPEVLLLLEGINNLRNVPTSQLASNFRSMVRTAQRRGVTVLPALVLPISASREAGRPGTQAAIRAFNEQIRRISLELGCGEPVDTHTPFLESPTLIGVDGLHPTEAGYVRMAEIFFQAIKGRWEEPTTAPVASIAGSQSLLNRAVISSGAVTDSVSAGSAPAATPLTVHPKKRDRAPAGTSIDRREFRK
jgi:lysophospholipase L1-like esterase